MNSDATLAMIIPALKGQKARLLAGWVPDDIIRVENFNGDIRIFRNGSPVTVTIANNILMIDSK